MNDSKSAAPIDFQRTVDRPDSGNMDAAQKLLLGSIKTLEMTGEPQELICDIRSHSFAAKASVTLDQQLVNKLKKLADNGNAVQAGDILRILMDGLQRMLVSSSVVLHFDKPYCEDMSSLLASPEKMKQYENNEMDEDERRRFEYACFPERARTLLHEVCTHGSIAVSLEVTRHGELEVAGAKMLLQQAIDAVNVKVQVQSSQARA